MPSKPILGALCRAVAIMRAQRFVAEMDNRACITIADLFEIPVVHAINDPHLRIPFLRFFMIVVPDELLAWDSPFTCFRFVL